MFGYPAAADLPRRSAWPFRPLADTSCCRSRTRGNGDFVCCGVIEKTPVLIAPIFISYQCIYDEQIPKMAFQECRRERCLSLHGLHDVRQLGAITAMHGIDHRVFQRGEVLQNNSEGSEVLAGNDDLFRSVLPVNTKSCFLGADSNAIENMTANILCNAAVGMAGVLILR